MRSFFSGGFGFPQHALPEEGGHRSCVRLCQRRGGPPPRIPGQPVQRQDENERRAEETTVSAEPPG